jgi:hypothetical protein
MVAPLVVAAVGMQALGMISDFIGGKKQAKAAKQAAERESWAERRVTSERIRQLGIEERTQRGETMAATAGSHVKVDTGSPLMLLAEQAREYSREKQFTREVGATKAAASMQRGRDVGNAVKYQSYGNLAAGASNIFSMLNNAGVGSSGT